MDVGHVHLVKYYHEEGDSGDADWSGHFNKTSASLKKMEHELNHRNEK